MIAPSPAGWNSTNATVELMREALRKVGAPEDLVQILPQPVSRNMTRLLMEQADLIVATGSQNNVRAAYSSGTPAEFLTTRNAMPCSAKTERNV